MSATDGSRFSRVKLLQSDEEWAARNTVLSRQMADLIDQYSAPGATVGIEIGCQHGALTEQMERLTRVPTWVGIDPALTEETVTDSGCVLRPARASRLEFGDETFDVALFANVFEHVPPDERDVSLREIYRVLKPGGVVVGQLPNPFFPIESHSRLPFMGWLPTKWQHRYWKLAPVSWDHDFYVVTFKHLKQTAQRAGFDVAYVRNFNYPPEVIPRSVRWAARLLERPMRYLPWSWQFVLVRPT
jgi:ubiquinone/menaquinone biosynthesis C-methylase UbiE